MISVFSFKQLGIFRVLEVDKEVEIKRSGSSVEKFFGEEIISL